MRPVILSIAGSDSSGGAGIQADLKTIEACGGYGATAITAVTAQNTRGVTGVGFLDPELVRRQIAAVREDLPVAAIKTGMLGRAETIRAVADELARREQLPLVCDPVMVSTSGSNLLDPDAVATLIERLLPLATVLTPNLAELRSLSGEPVDDLDGAAEAARGLLARGAGAVLVTGGHWADHPATDLLVTVHGATRFEGQPVATENTHGSGCTLAAALTTELGLGRSLEVAVGRAKEFVTAAIASGLQLGHGPGPVDPTTAGRRCRSGAGERR